MTRFAAALIATALVALAGAGTSSASFPGPNGPIAFQTLNDVWVVNPDGSGARQVSSGSATRDPAISPDGRSVAYAESRNLVITNIDGTGTRTVTTGGHNDQFPA